MKMLFNILVLSSFTFTAACGSKSKSKSAPTPEQTLEVVVPTPDAPKQDVPQPDAKLDENKKEGESEKPKEDPKEDPPQVPVVNPTPIVEPTATPVPEIVASVAWNDTNFGFKSSLLFTFNTDANDIDVKSVSMADSYVDVHGVLHAQDAKRLQVHRCFLIAKLSSGRITKENAEALAEKIAYVQDNSLLTASIAFHKFLLLQQEGRLYFLATDYSCNMNEEPFRYQFSFTLSDGRRPDKKLSYDFNNARSN